MPDSNKTYLVKANDFSFAVPHEEAVTTDIVKHGPGIYNLIRGHRSVTAKVLDADSTGKKLLVEVEGQSFEVEIKDELEQMLDKLGFSTASTKQVKEIKAPMPGLVIDIAVTDGQEVNEGDRILILEAMKMENSILIHTAAKIKRVAVTAGQAVEKGQLLVELE